MDITMDSTYYVLLIIIEAAIFVLYYKFRDKFRDELDAKICAAANKINDVLENPELVAYVQGIDEERGTTYYNKLVRAKEACGIILSGGGGLVAYLKVGMVVAGVIYTVFKQTGLDSKMPW